MLTSYPDMPSAIDPLHAIVLGVTQGLSEFLPISSSAHLVLLPHFMRWQDPGLAFDVALHMGTLAAILIFFWRDWADLAKQLVGRGDPGATIGWKLLVAGTAPAAVAGLLLQDFAETAFRSPILIAGTLAAFGLLLWYWDQRGRKTRALGHFTLRDALVVGCAQALAIVPGVSRSGITITAALALGFARPAALRFSFLLSAPIIGAAGILKSKAILALLGNGGAQASGVAWGFLSSLVSGLAAIGFLSLIVRSRALTGFVIYRLALSLVIVVVLF